MFKRLAILPFGLLAVSSVTLAMAPSEETKVIDLTRDAIQIATTTSTTSTTTSTTTTTVEVGLPPVPPTTAAPAGDWKCPEWLSTALQAGWAESELPMLDKVMFRESTCRIEAHNPDDPGSGSYGLMQINGAAWCDGSKYYPNGWLQDQGILYTCIDLFDPLINLRAALAFWQRSGWNPW